MPGPARRPIEDRFWEKVDKLGPIPELCPELGPCWVWTGGKNPRSGYGQFSKGGREGMTQAHRASYEISVGPIPLGATLDHLCNRRDCVNPDHIDPCSTGENSARGAQRRTACKRGHPYDENTYIHPTGYRRCRQCNTEDARRRRRQID